MAGSLCNDGQSLDIFEDRGIIIAGVHKDSESNIATDDHGEIHAGVAGDIFIRPHEKSELNYGSRAVANTWAILKEGTLDLADGAFVSVIYDSNSQCYAFNDFIGQVPFFYRHFGEATYFASKLRPFLESKSIPASIDTDGLQRFFLFGCVPGRRTILAGVRKIFPGSMIRITPNSVQEEKYWKISDVRINGSRSLKETIDSVESSLLISIKRRLFFGGNHYGILLGGLDSSIITAMLSNVADKKITAVTAVFADSMYNEEGPKQVANENEVDLVEILIDQEEMPEIVEEMAAAFDEPVSDMVACPVAFALMKKSRGIADTFFDGTGADDLFQGIPHGFRNIDLLNWLPSPLTSRFWKESFNGRGVHGYLPKKANLMSPIEREVFSWQQLSTGKVDLLTAAHFTKGNGEKIRKGSDGIVTQIVTEIGHDISGAKLDPRNITVKTAVSLYFGPTHGFDCSRNRAISSRYQVRIISPFYDRALYGIGLSVPWYYKMPSKGLSKPLLRRVAIEKGILPKEVALIKKKGLGSSRKNLADNQVKVWLKGDLSKWVSENITESLGLVKHYLNKDEAMKILRNGKPSQVFEILMFILWYKRYFVHEN